ncbi:MAG: sigma-54 dependent transcriptional regulator [Desulfocapsaceae bacterium]|nr:sigma-54 dependent transcriptional regulator [Desulfocapsaceae bacterium]
MQRFPTIVLAESNREDLESTTKYIRTVFDNDPGCVIIQAGDEAALLSCLKNKSYDIIVLNVEFPNSGRGLALFENLQRQHPCTVIIPVIPVGNDDLIKYILQLGTSYYLRKPYNPAEIEFVLKRAHEKMLHAPPSPAPPSSCDEQSNFYGIIGKTPCMKRLFDLITRIAEDDFSNVLIRGESGTGKELVAKAIHSHSKRRNHNFVPVNCAAIPDDLLESELFGHTKGAFTGATQNKIGRIQYADGGTLFLDEIGDMKGTLQAKLLRVLQEKEFEPVGALKSIPVDTRILAATHCDLEQLVSEGRFREDLYYRLSVIPLNVPPLKGRKEDIPLLLDYFIEAYTRKRGRDPIRFSGQALTALLHYEWRGNVRELENFVQHMCILFSGKKIEREDLPEKFLAALADIPETEDGAAGSSQPAFDSLDLIAQGPINISGLQWDDGQIDFNKLINDFETQLILQALRVSGGNKKEAARLLNLKRTTLLEKMKKKELTVLPDDSSENDAPQ